MMHDELRHSIGALLVGSLDSSESIEVRAHLLECEDCRAAYDEIAGLVGLLATVSAAEAEAGPPQPDDAMLARLISEVRHERRRERVRRIGLALASAAVAAAVAAGIVLVLDEGSSGPIADPGVTIATTTSPPSETLEASNPRSGISAEIALDEVAWGTVVRLHLRGVEPGYSCSLIAVAADGTREVTSSWTIPLSADPTGGTGSLSITGATGLDRASITRFEIVETDGTMLLTVPA